MQRKISTLVKVLQILDQARTTLEAANLQVPQGWGWGWGLPTTASMRKLPVEKIDASEAIRAVGFSILPDPTPLHPHPQHLPVIARQPDQLDSQHAHAQAHSVQHAVCWHKDSLCLCRTCLAAVVCADMRFNLKTQGTHNNKKQRAQHQQCW